MQINDFFLNDPSNASADIKKGALFNKENS